MCTKEALYIVFFRSSDLSKVFPDRESLGHYIAGHTVKNIRKITKVECVCDFSGEDAMGCFEEWLISWNALRLEAMREKDVRKQEERVNAELLEQQEQENLRIQKRAGFSSLQRYVDNAENIKQIFDR